MTADILELDAQLPAALLAGGYRVAFPIAHGPLGEDGCLQGLLEVLGIPYVGSGVLASAVAAHKPTAKRLFEAAGLPTAPGVLARRGDDLAALGRDVLERFGCELVLKPASGGSAIGVQRLLGQRSAEEIASALESAIALSSEVLVEKLAAGREVTCGVIETDAGTRALPPTLIRSVSSDWYDFRARYAAGGSQHECPAKLPSELYGKVQQCAVGAHCAVGARDLSRVDFVVLEDEVVVLEVNTLPGMTATSNYPEAAQVDGIDFPELCRLFVERTLARPARDVPTVEQIPE
jgi:D-alanine-D-alanine ligase